MKIQEAVENLKYLISGDCTDNQMDFVEEIEMGIQALEMHIPLKPIIKNRIVKTDKGYFLNDDNEEPYCPTCNRKLNGGEHHCVCGQSIVWKDHPTEKGGLVDD